MVTIAMAERYYCNDCKMWHGKGGDPLTLEQAKKHFEAANVNPDKHQAVAYREARDILALVTEEKK